MKTVDASAPQDVMRKNAHVLQQMIQSGTPKASTKLAQLDEPAGSTSIVSPKPVEVKVPDSVKLERAPSEPVEMASLADIPKPASSKPAADTVQPDKKELIAAERKPKPKVSEAPKTVLESEDSQKGLPFLRGSLD
jgi:hypothetical protein